MGDVEIDVAGGSSLGDARREYTINAFNSDEGGELHGVPIGSPTHIQSILAHPLCLA